MTTYKCSKCNTAFGSKGNAKDHIKGVKKCKGGELIENIVKVECSICNQEFDTDYLLSRHKTRCVAKKAILYEKIIDPREIKQSMTEIMNILNGLVNENKELVKRIEKLESVFKEEEEEEEIEECEDTEEVLCSHFKDIMFIPTSKLQVKTTLKSNNIDDYKNVALTLKGQRSLELNGLVEKNGIEVEGVMYFYNPEKGDKSASDIKIAIKRFCNHVALKNSKFCTEHS